MAEREDSGRQARPVVFLDDREQPQTLHDVARIMLECQDRSLDGDEITGEVSQEEPELRAVTLTITTVDPDSLIEDLKAYGYNPLEVEVDPTAAERRAEDVGRARHEIERTMALMRDGIKRLTPGEHFNPALMERVLIHWRLLRHYDELSALRAEFDHLMTGRVIEDNDDQGATP